MRDSPPMMKGDGGKTMFTRVRIAAALGSLSLSLAGSVTGAHADFDRTVVVGHVYVDDNTTVVLTRSPDSMNTPMARSRRYPGRLLPWEGLGPGRNPSQDALQLAYNAATCSPWIRQQPDLGAAYWLRRQFRNRCRAARSRRVAWTR